MSIDNSSSFHQSSSVPAFDVYSAALSIDPQNVVPNNTHCDNCFNDVTSEMKLFSCQHSICQTCLDGQTPGNTLYSTVFGQNQLCPICSIDSKPIVNGNNFLSNNSALVPNGNSIALPNNSNQLGYIPMNVFPPPEHSKPLSIDPFSSLIYQPPMPPPPHINGSHVNPFQGFNGNHKVHSNTGPLSPSLASTINSQVSHSLSDQLHTQNVPNPTPLSPHLIIPQPINSKPPIPIPHTLPTTLSNQMPPGMHTNYANNLPPNFPPNFPPNMPPNFPNLPNIFPPNLPNHFPPQMLTNFQTNFSIPKPPNIPISLPNTLQNLPNNLPIPPPSPNLVSATSNIINLPTTNSVSTSSSIASSEAGSLTGSINYVLCSCDEGISATAQCMDCEDFLCDSCVRAHRKVR